MAKQEERKTQVKTGSYAEMIASLQSKNSDKNGNSQSNLQTGSYEETVSKLMDRRGMKYNSGDAHDEIGIWMNRAYNTINNIANRNSEKYTTSFGGRHISDAQELIDSFGEVERYFEKNKNLYQNPDGLKTNITELYSSLKKAVEYGGDVNEYYAQFADANEYNNYLAYQKQQEEMLAFDLASERIALDQLSDQYDEATKARRRQWFLNPAQALGIDPYGTGKSSADMAEQMLRDALGDYSSYDELAKDYTARSQYYNQAEQLQKSTALETEAKSAPDFIRMSNAGKEIETDIKNEVLGKTAYSYMTDEQKRIYNYYLAKGGEEKASEYLATIEDSLNRAEAQSMAERMEYKEFLEILFGVAAAADRFGSSMNTLITGEAKPTSSIQYAGQLARQDLADNGAVLPKWFGQDEFGNANTSIGQMAYDLVDTTSYMLPSILASMAVGTVSKTGGAIVGGALLGASASGNAYAEMVRLGYNEQQSKNYAVMVGASEAALQTVLGGIGTLGGVLPKGISGAVLNKVDNAMARVAIQLGFNMAGEFTEEYLQEVLEPWFRNIAMHEENDVKFYTPEALYSGLLGALTAGVMEGGSTISGAIKTSNLGGKLTANNVSAERLANIGKTFSADTVAYRLAGKVNENTNAYTIGRLFNEIDANLSEQNKADITSYLEANGFDRENAKRNAEVLAYIVDGGEVSDLQRKMIEKNPKLAKAMQEVIINPNSTVYQRTYEHNEVLRALAGEMVGEAPSAAQNPVQQQNAAPETTAAPKQESSHKASQDGKTILAETGEEVTITGVKSTGDGKLTLQLSNGKTVDSSAVSYATEDEAAVYSAISKMDLTAHEANMLLSMYEANGTVTGEEYARGIEEAHRFGAYNFSEYELNERGQFTGKLTESQRKTAYKLGKTFSGRHIARNVVRRDGRVVAEVTDKELPAADTMLKLNERQKVAVQMLRSISKNAGVKFRYYSSYVNASGVRVYKDTTGKEQKAPNGIYVTNTGVVYIDLNAGNSGEQTILYTAAHELTHFIRDWSEEHFKTLANFLLKQYGDKKLSMDEIIREKMDEAKKRGRELDYDTAYEEFVADSMQTMLMDGKVAEKLAIMKEQDQTLWEKIRDFFRDLAARIQKAYEGLHPNSKEARFVSEMGDAVNRLQELFAEGLAAAGENYQSALNSVIKSEAKPISADEIITEGAVVTDGNGKKFSIRSMKHDIADGKMFDDLVKHCGWSEERVSNLKTQLSDLVEYMTPHKAILDMNEAYGMEGRRFSPYKPNSDPLYKISMDFSTLCSKRLLTQFVIENLQLRENRPMSAEEQMAIRDMLNEYRKVEKGLQVACAMCYVEAARLKSPNQILKWMGDPATQMSNYFADKNAEFSQYIKDKQADFKESKGYSRNATKKDMSAKDVAALNKIRPKLRSEYKPSTEELAIMERAKQLPNSTYLTAANLASLSETDPEIYKAYTAFVRTATRSKSLETDEPYYYGDSARDNGNGIVVSDSFIEAVNRENGMRFSSWSDWRIIHLLDYITAVIDNSVRGAAMHGYTKFGEEVRVLGKTGMMFNMSGVAGTQTGLNEDGSLSFSPTESINADEAVKLRDEFPDTAGLQCIGVGYDHIVALLRSDIIDYVIPYHVSGLNAALRRMAKIYGWKDYTSTQHAVVDKSIKRDDAADKDNWHIEPVFSEFFVGYNTGLSGVEAMRETAKRYVQMCKDRGLTPKFNEFAKEDGYWKLLVDRKMINQKTGELIQQKPVQPVFDFDEIKRVVDEYVTNYDSGMERRALNHIVENWDSIPQRIKDLKKADKSPKVKKAKKGADTLANEIIAAWPVESQAKKFSDREVDTENYGASSEYSPAYTGEYPAGKKFQHREDNPETLSFLEGQVDRGEYTTVYKALLKIGDTYYPPMASLEKDENGKYTKLRGGQKLYDWIASDGILTEEMKAKMNMKSPKAWMNKYSEAFKSGLNPWGMYGDFKLKKADDSGKSQGDVAAAYNPYQHSSDLVLNDQFEGAYNRPGLVVVECRIPNSELTNPYWAPYAKDPTGVHDWKSGPIASQLKKTSRHVYMTRWIQPVRELSNREVAEKISDLVNKEDKHPRLYWNTMSPGVLKELTKLGVEVDPYGSPMHLSHKNALDMYGNPVPESVIEEREAEKTSKKRSGQNSQDKRYSDRGDMSYDRTSVLSVETVDSYLRKYASSVSPKYAQAYITYMSPDRFLKLTTKGVAGRAMIEGESTVLNEGALKAANAEVPIHLTIDTKTGKVTGHEGRHRMVAIYRAGVENVPVLLFDSSNKYTKTDLTEYTLRGQFDSSSVGVDFAIPFNYENRDRIIENFATKSSMQKIGEKYGRKNVLMYSERDTAPVSNRAILSNALEGTAQNELERKKIQQYKEKIAEYNEAESKLVNLRRQIQEMSFAEGKRDKAKITELRNEATAISNRLTIYDSQLLRLEASKPLKNLVERERVAAKQEGAKETKRVMEEYRTSVIAKQAADLRQIRALNETVRGLKDDTRIMEREFIRLAREYEKKAASADRSAGKSGAKISDLRNALMAEAKAHKADQKVWEREFMRLLKEYEYSGRKIARLEQKVEDQRAAAKAKIASRGRTELRHKIQRVVKELNDYLLKGTKDKHVMAGLQQIVAESLDIVNMDTVGADERIAALEKKLMAAKTPKEAEQIAKSIERIREQGGNMKAKIDRFKAAYAEIKTSTDPMISNIHDDVIEAKIEYVASVIGDTALRDMNAEQLQEVYEMYKMVLTTIRNANKAFKQAKSESIAIMANNVMEEVKAVGGVTKMRMKFVDSLGKFGWNNFKPIYAFKQIGSKTLSAIFDSVRSGEDVWAVDVTEARAFYREQAKKYHYDRWNFDKRYRFESSSEMQFELGLEQIMSLYAYSRREQAIDHLLRGGIVFDETTEVTMKTKLGIPVTFKPTEATAYNISMETLSDIISKLTPEQRAFVEAMQGYLSDVMGAKGNEVSMEMYGVKLFNEKFYFPLKSASQFMAKAKEQQEGTAKIKNSGFSKETVKKANNPIVLTPFMDVWANHVNDMSMYHAFVLPMEDFYRVYNYKTPTDEKMATESVIQFIQNAYGTGAVKYIDQLLKDLNGGARTDPTAGVINKLMGMFKKGAVFASASVVIQQPSSIARAAALIDSKYFIGPKMDAKRHDALWSEIKRYAPVAIIKEMGYFDTHMGQSTKDFIKAKEYNGFGQKAKAVLTDSTFRDDMFSKAPALADEFAWCLIWEAVKRETKARNPQMAVNSEAFLQKAGERFTEVIVATQVYDSVLSRSANMRSKDTGMKMAMAFMAEPTTTINMVADAITQGKRGDRKYARTAIGAAFASAVLNAVLVSFVYAGRDDDEDETYGEKYISSVVAEIIDGVNPLTYIPFVKDIISIIRGYDVERSDIAVISEIWSAFEQLGRDNVSVYRKVENLAGSISKVFGLPVKNIMRDVRGLMQTVNTIRNGEAGTKAGIGYAVKGAITNKTVTDRQQLYEALVSGDTEHANRVMTRFEDQSAIDSAIKKALRENDPRIMEAAEAYYNGDLDTYTRIAKEIIAEGVFKQDYVVGAITTEVNNLKPDTEPNAPKAKALYTVTDFGAAVAAGDKEMAGAVREEIIRIKIENGKTEQEAVDSFEESAKGELHEQYAAGNITYAEAAKALVEFVGLDKEAADGAVAKWMFEVDYGVEYADRMDAYMSGAVSRDDVVDSIAAAKNISLEDAEKDFASEARSWCKESFENGDISAGEAERILRTDCGDDDARTTVEYWEFAMDNPDVSVDDSWFVTYHKEVEASGVSLDVYINYRSAVKSITGDGKKERRMAVIHSLPISAAQKDAIYLSEGWAISRIGEAPWR